MMLYTIYNDTENISDYVIDIKDIPIFARNEDYTLIAEGYTFVLTSAAPNIPVKDDRITVYRNDATVHIGFVSKISYTEERKTYSIEVSHQIQKLKDYRTDDEFATEMLNWNTIKSINSYNHTVISFTNLISAIFAMIDLTLDWSLFVEKTDYTATGYTGDGTNNDFHQYGVPAFGESNIFFLPNQVLCMNQAKCWSPSYLNTEEGSRNRVSLFDLLSHLISMVGFAFIPKDDVSFYVVNSKTDYTFADDNILKKEQEDNERNSLGLTISFITLKYNTGKFIFGTPPYIRPYWFPYADGQKYYYDSDQIYNGDANDVTEYIYSSNNFNHEDESTIPWYNNFNPFVLIPHDGTHTYYIIEPVLGVGRTFPIYYITNWKINAYTKTTIETYASTLFPIVKSRLLSAKITDINKDLIEIEVIE